MDHDDVTADVKALALAGGFARVGVAPATAISRSAGLETWLERGWHGEMAYMARHREQRLRPDRLVDGARSVLCLCASYAPAAEPPDRSARVARYARGRDYHKVLKKRCHALMDRLREIAPDFQGRAFVDSAPVMERSLAAAAGVGWIGRNGCLIAPDLGSWVVLAEIVSNLPLTPDAPLVGTCGDCGRCVRACPTGALNGEGLLDARKCISYLTVEHAGPIDEALWPAMGTSVFGCDLCQEACPHNRGVPAGDPDTAGDAAPLGGASLAKILTWTESDWDRATRGSALRRCKLPALLRNALIAAGNLQDAPADQPTLLSAIRGVGRDRPELAPLADWAAARLGAGRS